MTPSTQATARTDPYRNFNFLVSWNGQPVAGVSQVSGLARTTDPIEHREGADPVATPMPPERTQTAPVTLERGVSYDPAFASWANQVWSSAQPSATPPAQTNGAPRDLNLALYNEAGQKVIAYNLYRCRPSEFEGMSEQDANGNAVVIQRLVLQLEGWERDTSVPEP